MESRLSRLIFVLATATACLFCVPASAQDDTPEALFAQGVENFHQGDYHTAVRIFRRVFEIDPRWLSRYSVGVTKNIEYEWHYRVDTTMDITVNSKEHIDWCWVSIEKATELVWSWTNREALKRLRASLAS